jgi:hypothetical protein
VLILGTAKGVIKVVAAAVRVTEKLV